MRSTGATRGAEVLVAYESMFGNTAAVASAIADALATTGLSVDAQRAQQLDSKALHGRRLVVLGAPTHGFALPRPLSRRAAGVASVPGLREFLATAEAFRQSPPAVAAFDVRSAPGEWPTSVAGQLVRRLQRLGAARVLGARSFHVERQAGPLFAGDLERAASWAHELALTLDH